MEAELPANEIDELRNDMAAMYDDVRDLLVRLPLDDRDHRTPRGDKLRHIVAQLVSSPMREARAARRLAGGRAGASWSPSRLLDFVTDWRLQRALHNATRRDLLAAWEGGFNELFSTLNDAVEATFEPAGSASARARAVAHLCGAPARAADRTAAARHLIETP